MTGQTASGLIRGKVGVPEGEYVPFSALLSVLESLAVAGRATGGCSGVGSQAKSFDRSLVAGAAGLCLFDLRAGPGGDQEDERRGG